MSAIAFDAVTKIYTGSERDVVALDGVTFSVAAGEYVALLGPTGCGKSTTINLILGLDRPTGGTVSVLGDDPATAFAHLRAKVACIFQSDRLLPWRTAWQNVALPLEILGRGEQRSSALAQLASLGLEAFADAYPHELSGGMRQRVAIARALVSDPAILLADEAFGHLDEATAGELRTRFRAIAQDGGKTVVHVTHSIDEALALADRIVIFARPGHVAAIVANDTQASDHARRLTRNAIRSTLDRLIAV